MLKNSARNSSRPASPKNPSLVSLTSEKSQFLSGGPFRILRPAVPNWPIVFEQFVNPGPVQFGAIENMAGLNHWLGLPVMTVLGIVDDWLVGAWVDASCWLARLRSARISGQQRRSIDIDPVTLLGLRDAGIRAIVRGNRREWLAALDAHDAAHEPAVHRLGQNAIVPHQVREVVQHIDFPVVGDIKAGRALVHTRVQRINAQQATRSLAILYVGLALRFICHLATRVGALEFQSMAGPFF